MKRLGYALLSFLLFVPLAFAKPRDWQAATVVKAQFGGTETEAVAVPLPGGGAVGESSTSSGKHARGVYWLKTDKYTYVIPNYCKANLGHTMVALPHRRRTNQNLRGFRQNSSRDRRRRQRPESAYHPEDCERATKDPAVGVPTATRFPRSVFTDSR